MSVGYSFFSRVEEAAGKLKRPSRSCPLAEQASWTSLSARCPVSIWTVFRGLKAGPNNEQHRARLCKVRVYQSGPTGPA